MHLMMKHVVLACLLLASVCATGIVEQVSQPAWDIARLPIRVMLSVSPPALAQKPLCRKALIHSSFVLCNPHLIHATIAGHSTAE